MSLNMDAFPVWGNWKKSVCRAAVPMEEKRQVLETS